MYFRLVPSGHNVESFPFPCHYDSFVGSFLRSMKAPYVRVGGLDDDSSAMRKARFGRESFGNTLSPTESIYHPPIGMEWKRGNRKRVGKGFLFSETDSTVAFEKPGHFSLHFAFGARDLQYKQNICVPKWPPIWVDCFPLT